MWTTILEYVLIAALAVVAYHRGMLPVVLKRELTKRLPALLNGETVPMAPSVMEEVAVWQAVAYDWSAHTGSRRRPIALPCCECGTPLLVSQQLARAVFDEVQAIICGKCEATDATVPDEDGVRRWATDSGAQVPLFTVPRPVDRQGISRADTLTPPPA